MEEITTLIEKELELEDVDQETRDLVISEIGATIMERVLITLLAKDEDGEVEKLIEEGRLGEAFEYADQNYPYLGEILEATASDVILEYKSAA